MASERLTEELVQKQMGFSMDKNPWGWVYPQADVSKINGELRDALTRAGGKPKQCAMGDFECGGKGMGKPEFVMLFDSAPDTVLVVECKASLKKHASPDFGQPDAYAVDGALYYAKFIKDYYNVIAVAVSGTSADNYKANVFYWNKGLYKPLELAKARDVLYSPENYLKLVRGDRVSRAVSIDEIRKLALVMHDALRVLKMPERVKPVFVAGILIALKDEAFAAEYQNSTRFASLLDQVNAAINRVLVRSDIRADKINDIRSHFSGIGRNTKLREVPLNRDFSLLWFVSELDKKIKPMMDYADNTIDALGIFYHEFVKYSGGDGKGLGIVLTPQHLTEFMCDLAKVNKNSRVVDICCGSGAFLVTAMSRMFVGANKAEINYIKQNNLYGVEADDDIYTLAIANMIVRGDGKSNIYYGSCFNPEIREKLKAKNLTVGLINPPYSQKDYSELKFVKNMLDLLVPGGTGVVVVPMSCAIGTKFKEEREALFKDHTLKAVFSMPDDIFYSNNASTNVCVMVWEAHRPHDSSKQTFFGYYKNDGFVKAKKLGRIDKFNRWENIKKEWLDLYENLDVKDGMTAKKAVGWNDEWLCEAYMETDYSNLRHDYFENALRNCFVHQIKIQQSKNKTFVNTGAWRSFALSDIFDIKRGVRLTRENRIPGDVPLATAGEYDEGISDFVANEDMIRYRDRITIDMFCNAFYRGYEFVCDDNILVLEEKQQMSKFAKLFIVSVINMDRYRFAYGRQFRQKDFAGHQIKLPVDKDGNPDWAYMENYIKSLPYADKI